MQQLTKRWQVATRLRPEEASDLHGYHPVLAQILYNRGFRTHEEARRFLEAIPDGDTDPRGMLGIAEAVDRILAAIAAGEKIAVYGDYDADGVTATALLTLALQSLGADVLGYIPNRFDEGYGLNNEALETLRDQGIRLVITVDCGIRSLEEAEHAKKIGLDLIISDHHHLGGELPEALAVINPKQPGDHYFEKELAGVGLAYKLAIALLQKFNPRGLQPTTMLDLVAVGTVADLAPLVGENRSLVRAGLEYIRRPQRQGLMSLIGAAGLSPEKISATDIGFGLGPRLNAAGRLDSAQASLNLLLTNDVFEAGQLAQQLEIQNRERQQITRDMQEHAEALALAENPDALVLIAVHPEYNPGVVGLAASRLTDRFYRPAIVAQRGAEFTRGSCRSIPEFHITHALDSCADLLEHHGGHAAAAGFTIQNDHLPEFIERMQAIAQKMLDGKDLRATLNADIELPLSELKPEILKHLAWLQPTGYSNPQAAFVSRELKVTKSRPVGKDGAHLKLTVTDGRITYDAIAFRQGHWQDQMPGRVDLLYNFELNEFNGRTTLQLNVRDLKASGAAD